MSPGLRNAAHRLSAVLEAENLALTTLNFAQVGLYQGEKRAALAAFDSLAAEAADPTSEKDRELAVRLQVLAKDNRRLLEQAILVQNRIMAVLASAARTIQAPVGYGAKGRLSPRNGNGAVALIVRA